MALKNKIQTPEVTREERKQEKQEQQGKFRIVRKRKIRVRLIPIWLRLVIITVLTAVSIFLGALFGYSVIGDGKASDLFKKSTWTHILDLVGKEE